MENFKSTMGAPLTEAETSKIIDRWQALSYYAATLPADAEQLEMLEYCTELVMLIWEVRRAIDEGWYQANRRVGPQRVAPKPKGPIANNLAALGITPEQLAEFLQEQEIK